MHYIYNLTVNTTTYKTVFSLQSNLTKNYMNLIFHIHLCVYFDKVASMLL